MIWRSCTACTTISARTAAGCIEYQGVLVGDVSLCGELAIVVYKAFQNRHIGRRCIREMLKLSQEKGMDTVKANTYAFNTQSQRIFLSAGFVKTDGEWYEYRLPRRGVRYDPCCGQPRLSGAGVPTETI